LRRPPVVRCVQRPIRIAALCNCIDSLVRPRRKQTRSGAHSGRSSSKDTRTRTASTPRRKSN
jgi:hypothetical protein